MIKSFRKRVRQNCEDIQWLFTHCLEESFPSRTVTVSVTFRRPWYHVVSLIDGIYDERVVSHDLYVHPFLQSRWVISVVNSSIDHFMRRVNQ
jgi:hypothetical protein